MNAGWWEGITVKLQWGSFPSLLFLPIWEEKFCGPERENFLPGIPLLLFSSRSQTEENPFFYPIFLLIFSIPPKIHPTKHSVREENAWVSQKKSSYFSLLTKQLKNLGPFGNVVLVTLFVFFENSCEWKSVWKYM